MVVQHANDIQAHPRCAAVLLDQNLGAGNDFAARTTCSQLTSVKPSAFLPAATACDPVGG